MVGSGSKSWKKGPWESWLYVFRAIVEKASGVLIGSRVREGTHSCVFQALESRAVKLGLIWEKVLKVERQQEILIWPAGAVVTSGKVFKESKVALGAAVDDQDTCSSLGGLDNPNTVWNPEKQRSILL